VKAIEDKFRKSLETNFSKLVRSYKHKASSSGGESRWVIVRSAQSLYSVFDMG